MPLFCQICNNVLEKITSASDFYFKCNQCKSKYNPEPEDTIQFEESKEANFVTQHILMKHAAEDPINPKVEKKCEKCGHKYMRRIRVGEGMWIIDSCIKCNNQVLA